MSYHMSYFPIIRDIGIFSVLLSKSLKKEESMWSIILLALMIRLFLVE